jgi:hypothetical protein
VNDNLHTYNHVATNEGLNSSGNPVFHIVVSNSSIETEEGTITWSSDRYREWIAGFETGSLTLYDDEYLITGGANGTDRNGNAFTITILEALHIKYCPWIVAGKLEIVRADFPDVVVDYGNGNCDAQATATINGETYNIIL